MILPGTGRGTSRRLVEGALRLRDNSLGSALNARENALRCHSQNSEPLVLDEALTIGVGLRPAAHIVNPAIHFDD